MNALTEHKCLLHRYLTILNRLIDFLIAPTECRMQEDIPVYPWHNGE